MNYRNGNERQWATRRDVIVADVLRTNATMRVDGKETAGLEA